MKISTKGRYAVRLMLDLATTNSKQPVRLKDVAARQEISDKYLEQIIGILHKAGFVRSVRGAMGGYILTRDPADYTVGEILRLTEGSLSPVDCTEDPGLCPRETACATAILWRKISEAVNNVVDNVTLEDLLSWQDSLTNDYVI